MSLGGWSPAHGHATNPQSGEADRAYCPKDGLEPQQSAGVSHGQGLMAQFASKTGRLLHIDYDRAARITAAT